jgi:hypothetical protein
MYAFLLVLGSVIAAAGLALVASGISIQQHTFDLSDVTPGTVAIIGGLILIGLAMVVRALLRVEQALIARPAARPARAAEAVGAVIAPAQAVEAGQIPLPPKPKTVPRPQPAPSAPARNASVEDATLLQPQVPVAERVEGAPMVEEGEVSLLPRAPVRLEEEKASIDPAVAGRANGAAHGKGAPAIAVSGRPVRKPQQQQVKGSVFDSLWPKAQRPAAEIQTAPPAVSAVAPAPAPVVQRAETGEPVPSPQQPAAPPQVTTASASILKSGVVEGMAYTLYSDGSIEAQLPGGTLRFGSITELRNHIEQSG